MDNKQESRGKPSLFQAVALVTIALLAAFLLVPMILSVRKRELKRSCADNLRQLGTYLLLYFDSFGEYSAFPPPGRTPNGLNYLREMPSNTAAVAARRHELFVCPVLGTEPDPVALDYRYQAQRIYGDTQSPEWPFVCDQASNHDSEGEDDINVLMMDGSVRVAEPGETLWDSCVGPGSRRWMEGP